MLIVEKISKKIKSGRRERQLFSDFSIDVQDGNFFGIYGPRNSGKSTLMRILGGLQPPDDGKVFLHGRDIYEFSDDERTEFRGRHIGFVFQDSSLFPYLNVMENIMLPAVAAHKGKSSLFAKKLMKDLALTDKGSLKPSELTPGESKRTEIARAMFGEPSLLLLDEPTAKLDSDDVDIIISALRTYAEKGHGVVVFTHSKDLASKTDKIFSLPPSPNG